MPELTNLPNNLDAEKSVLGGLILEPEAFTEVLPLLSSAEMFHLSLHQEMFSCLMNMYSTGTVIDNITFADEIFRSGVFETREDANTYINQLLTLVPSTANIESYARIVQDKYYLRRLMRFSNELLEETAQADSEAIALLDDAEQKLYDIRRGRDNASLVSMRDAVASYYDKLMKLTSADPGDQAGYSTGFRTVDAIIGGLHKSDLVLVAGRPGMGKSSFATNIATNVALRSKKDVVMFNLEMSVEQITARILSSLSGIRNDKFRSGDLNAQEWVTLCEAADHLSQQSIYLDDTADITAQQMKAKLRRVPNLGLVVIDYLQLMSSGGRATDNRVQEISQITRSLKILAKELDVPVILLSQLSRATEGRQGHRPMLSDLRESGSIEQDADIVMLLYREGYYDKECKMPNLAQCIVAKNRHGATADADLIWCGERTSFADSELERNEDDYAGY